MFKGFAVAVLFLALLIAVMTDSGSRHDVSMAERKSWGRGSLTEAIASGPPARSSPKFRAPSAVSAPATPPDRPMVDPQGIPPEPAMPTETAAPTAEPEAPVDDASLIENAR